jgi:hypothetical protein
MTWPDVEKNHNDEPKKSKLLPAGDNAKEIVELLAAMYRAIHHPEDAANDYDNSEPANQQTDAEKEG